MPGKQNIVADGLSKINTEKGTYDIEQENIRKVYHILKARKDLEGILNQVKEHQTTDPKLKTIRERLENNDPTIIPFYCIHNNLIFTHPTSQNQDWKLVIRRTAVSSVILEYHVRYGHMRPLKVVKALTEHVYIKVHQQEGATDGQKLQDLPDGQGKQ